MEDEYAEVSRRNVQMKIWSRNEFLRVSLILEERVLSFTATPITRLSGSLVSCASNRWLPSRNSSANAWNANNTGTVDNNNFFNTLGVLPISN